MLDRGSNAYCAELKVDAGDGTLTSQWRIGLPPGIEGFFPVADPDKELSGAF